MATSKTIFNITEERTSKLAVLIDADNASAKDIKNILDELTKYGEATVKRIYGNFTSTQNTQWKKIINELAIKPVQQFEYTTGKNATDGFMIIDAMDLLYTNRFDGFAIVSSDSDFTALAIRIKEQGATVYGFGKKQTPEAFKNACSQFIYVENLRTDEVEEEIIIPKSISKTASKENEVILKSEPIQNINTTLPLHTIKQIFDNQDSEWITVASFGSQWKLLQTDFDPRNYGFKKLGDLVKNTPQLFEYDERTLDNGHKHSYMKLKK
ncbi:MULTISPECIES: NYN domain-containing protein [Acinetobacter Taxon 24]|uniref:NYN domain-containing protein n=1 Tax=Acinetobacter Taxon 24 TaxID=2839056 RepID=UPI00103DC7B2|nr:MULTISPECIES: NYN domain-containing protein [Acinetobacter Taxon 24]NNG75016.1 NYN domain-containing protein [Acinetobacter terrae]TCH62871.1 NYN domain-containing protein [Acinetobacter sp. ANC 4862]